MVQHENFAVVLPVKPFDRDEYLGSEHLPLHCTLMPWFRWTRPVWLLINELVPIVKVAEAEGPITLLSESPAILDRAGEKQGHWLKADQALQQFHTRILIRLSEFSSAPSDVQYIAAGYRPHVSSVGGCTFPPGSAVVARSVVLLRRDAEGDRTVATRYELE